MNLFHIFHLLNNLGLKIIRSNTFIVAHKDKIYGKSVDYKIPTDKIANMWWKNDKIYVWEI